MYHCMVKPITITSSSSLSKHSDQTGLLILTYLIKYLLLYKEKPEEGPLFLYTSRGSIYFEIFREN